MDSSRYRLLEQILSAEAGGAGWGGVRGGDSVIADLNVLIMAGKWVWHSATADTNAGSVCEMPAARHPAQGDVHVIFNTLS